MPRHRGMGRPRRSCVAHVAHLPRLAGEAALSLARAAGAACAPGTTEPAPARLAQPARLASPAATFNQLQAISGVTNTPLFESVTLLVPYFTHASAARSVALTALSLELAARYSPSHRSVRLTTHQPVPTRCRRPRRPVLTPCPPLHHADPGAGGKTFVWDPDTSGYVVSADSGAPRTASASCCTPSASAAACRPFPWWQRATSTSPTRASGTRACGASPSSARPPTRAPPPTRAIPSAGLAPGPPRRSRAS